MMLIMIKITVMKIRIRERKNDGDRYDKSQVTKKRLIRGHVLYVAQHYGGMCGYFEGSY